MPMGPVLHGKEGKCYKVGTPDVELEILDWEATPTVATERYMTSMSDGATVSEPGGKSLDGRVKVKRRTDGSKIEALIREGDKVSLKLGFNSSTGILCPATIKSLKLGADLNGGVQEAEFTFENNGLYSFY